MDIYQGLNNIDKYNNVVIALGNFDGVHLGHRELISKTIETARGVNGTPAVFTFDPHPMKVLQPDGCPPMLLTKQEKIRILSDLGLKLLIISPFSDISRLSPEEFVKSILVEKFKVRAVVAGYNYNFGYKGAGNAEMLARLAHEYGFDAVVIPPVKFGEVEVSSTLIRQLLLAGNVWDAARFLGYLPFVVSRVVTGDRRGRQIGFPTANLNLPEDILVPATGVYAVRVTLRGHCLNGVANIGIKPTFSLNQPKNLEVHIFDFNDDIYDTVIKVEFVKRIRGEQEFSSVDELVRQIKTDSLEAKRIFSQ
ncbi:MAG: bifunctional riboflavin kinase/FAD synthetase [Eubacteriales bacterium]